MAPDNLLWSNFLTLFGGTVCYKREFLELDSPYVRVTLDRSQQERREEECISGLVELSRAAGVRPYSSGTGDRVVDLSIL